MYYPDLARSKFIPDGRFRESTSLPSKQSCEFVYAHTNLLSHRDEAFGQMRVVLLQRLDREHYIIYVAENESVFFGITFFLFKQGRRVVPPMPAGVQVMGRVVSIIETEAVTLRLLNRSDKKKIRKKKQ